MAETFEKIFAEGYRARRENRSPQSRAIFLDAVRKAAEQGDEPALAEALCGLAQAENDIGNCEASQHHYANAVALYRRIGPPGRLAYAARHEADLRRQNHHYADAETLYREAEGIYRHLGQDNLLDLANTLRGLALVNDETGNRTTSRSLWLEARVLYASQNVEAGVAECDQQLSRESSR